MRLAHSPTEKLKCIPLSNNTVSCRINDISGNLQERLITRLKAAGDFFIRLDENADISACASLLVYIRHRWENEPVEDLICCLTIPTSLTGEEIFDALNNYMVTKSGLEFVQRNNNRRTSGEPLFHSSTGTGMQRVKEVHCVVSFIKGSALDNWLFDQVCSDVGAEHMYLLFQTETRWCSYRRFWTKSQNSASSFSLLICSLITGFSYSWKLRRPFWTNWIWNWKTSQVMFSKTENMFLLSGSPWSYGSHAFDKPDPKPLSVSFFVTTQHKKTTWHTQTTSSRAPLGSQR